MTVRKSFPMLPAQLGVRTTRLDQGVLNVTCVFQFTASARASDAGKVATVTARVRNTNCSTCRGWTGMTGDDGGGYIGIMIGRDSNGEPMVQVCALATADLTCSARGSRAAPTSSAQTSPPPSPLLPPIRPSTHVFLLNDAVPFPRKRHRLSAHAQCCATNCRATRRTTASGTFPSSHLGP